jgi:hypothetical protein
MTLNVLIKIIPKRHYAIKLIIYLNYFSVKKKSWLKKLKKILHLSGFVVD